MPAIPKLKHACLINFAEGLIKVSFEDAKSLGKSLDEVVHVPPDLVPKYGEGIVVSSDLGHELHCLVSSLHRNLQQVLMSTTVEHDTDVHISRILSHPRSSSFALPADQRAYSAKSHR